MSQVVGYDGQTVLIILRIASSFTVFHRLGSKGCSRERDLALVKKSPSNLRLKIKRSIKGFYKCQGSVGMC